MYSRIARLLTLALFFLQTSAAAMQLGQFYVKEHSGTVFYKLPLSPTWKTLTTETVLPTGTLVQVQKDSLFVYSYRLERTVGWNGDESIVRVKSPMNFMLDPNILRPANLSSLFMERIPEVKEYQWRISVSEYFPLLKYAWDRMAIFVSRDDTTADYVDDLFRKAESQNIEVGVTSSKLNLLYPGHGDAEHVGVYPVDVDVIWEKSKKQRGPYVIYVWPSKDARPASMATTPRTSYTVSFNKPGSYYVQVATRNRRAWSKAHLFHLSEPMVGTAMDANQGLFNAVHPAESVTFVSEKNQYPVHFLWRTQPGIDFSNLELELKTGKKPAETVKLDPSTSELLKPLSPGIYEWRLKVKYVATLGNSKVVKGSIETPARKFKVVRGDFNTALKRFSRSLSGKMTTASERIHLVD